MRRTKNMRTFLSIALVSVVTAACVSLQGASNSIAQQPAAKPTSEVVLTSEVKWTPLNPLRGDKSPKAGTLWGDPDRKFPVATGFLVQFADGFSSPPHIHNITYRGVVISGLVHNDDPNAAKMWMPTGSFWTQPAGKEIIRKNAKARLIPEIKDLILRLCRHDLFNMWRQYLRLYKDHYDFESQPGLQRAIIKSYFADALGLGNNASFMPVYARTFARALLTAPTTYIGKCRSPKCQNFYAITYKGKKRQKKYCSDRCKMAYWRG